ncbi:hypothetical protein BJ875DRAFT_452851 [Amylocarpus encephaloides]|uniref:ATPase synthesis protein 25 n=1 Tax=Amylocarpus encephaloides TaxID=45428 RepID=A0A9P7YRK3_9HELO|nr:hypothetical protein BJ875DRAFT_452851 [Amylocarpus encephaloides]
MVVIQALRGTRCTCCRLSLMRSFTSIGGYAFRFPQTTARLPPCSSPIARQVRQHSHHHNDTRQVGWGRNQHDAEVAIEEEEATLEEKGNLEETEEVSEVTSSEPWYLQVEAPERTIKPLSERQKLPDLPESPPLILQPLLRQVSIDLGLDDLYLLDLRTLDPPPALGANLLMLIGTARSERHLHVSADRLCRWLRSTYKLRPDADGLLGRNELKLKLRRKAKRAKLMGSTEENADDGVRTGWVCVDVGVVEGVASKNAVEEPTDFVGFGRKTDGVRIVVQMLTEEKREEIELERLWGGILKRSQGGIEDADEGESTTGSPMIISSQPSLGTAGIVPKSHSGTSSTVASVRGLHTSVRRFQNTVHGTSSSHSKREGGSEATMQQAFYNSVDALVIDGDYEGARTILLENADNFIKLQADGWRMMLQEKLLLHIQSLPKDTALESLGNGHSDYSSTAFLSSFYKSLSVCPSAAEVEARVWLYSFARALGHPGYEATGLLDLFAELQISGSEISPVAYEHILRGVLRPDEGTPNYHGPDKVALQGALKILQAMYDQGLQILDETILVDLQETISPGLPDDDLAQGIITNAADTLDLPSYPLIPIQRRLHILMMTIDVPCFRDETRLRLLDLYRRQKNWVEFWDVFRMAARRAQPQSSSMYAFIFASIAQSKHQKACMNVVRIWAPELAKEIPPIPIAGQVAQGIRACLKVADPFVEEDAIKNPESNGEWISWWNKCKWSKEGSDQFLYE